MSVPQDAEANARAGTAFTRPPPRSSGSMLVCVESAQRVATCFRLDYDIRSLYFGRRVPADVAHAFDSVATDKEELAAISGVAIAASDDPLTINLYYNPSRDSRTRADTDVHATFHFRISIPPKYPFHPPLFKWISRPSGPAGHTPFLGPNGDVSISALSHWTPASSLSNVLISLFPSALLAAQCCSVTSHIWLMGEGKGASSTAFTDPQVLHCLAEYLLCHEPASAHSLHQTCRAAASAVQQAVSSLSVVAQHVDIVHCVHTFSGLSQLKCTQCALTCQSVFQVDPSLRLMSSLRSLAVIRCSVDSLLGAGGMFAALKALPHLDEFAFEPATSMLWALYDNRGQTEHASNPFGEDAVMTLPPEVPRPVPDEWASIWVGLASVTQLKTLKVTAPLCDMAFAPRDASRQGWTAAARIVNYAFSEGCLSSMPCLQNLTIDLQHVNMRSARPGEALQPSDQRPSERNEFCAWDLPSCQLSSLLLSGVAFGDRQLNYHQATKDFWGRLEHLEIGHTAVADDLQATALKMLVYLAKNVKSLNVASLEELLSKLASNPMSPVSYVTLSKLERLSTTLIGKLADVRQLTHLELRSCKSYVNLSLVAESLPQLRILEGLPFKPGTDHRFYWPLRQCLRLEKLVTLPGMNWCRPPGAASSIKSVLGPGVHVHVPVWAEDCPESQAVFRRGFFPAHRPMLSSYDPSNSTDMIAISPGSPSNDAAISAYQGYALGRIRSQSPVPSHIADSPSGHDSGSARPADSNAPVPEGGERRMAADEELRAALPPAPAYDADASLAGSVIAAPQLPGTPAPANAIGGGLGEEDALNPAEPPAGGVQGHVSAGSSSHVLDPASSAGVMAGMASWGVGLGPFFTAQLAQYNSRQSLPGGPSHAAHPANAAGRAGCRSRQTGQFTLHSEAQPTFAGSDMLDAADLQRGSNEPRSGTRDVMPRPPPVTADGSLLDGMTSEGVMEPQFSSCAHDSQMDDTPDVEDMEQQYDSWSPQSGGASGQAPPGLTGAESTGLAGAGAHPLANHPDLLYNSASGDVWARFSCAPFTGAGSSRPHPALEQPSALLTGTFQSVRHEDQPHRRTSSEHGGRMYKRHAGGNVLQAHTDASRDQGSLTSPDPNTWPVGNHPGGGIEGWNPAPDPSTGYAEQARQSSTRRTLDGMFGAVSSTRPTCLGTPSAWSTGLAPQDGRGAQAWPSHSLPNMHGASASTSRAAAGASVPVSLDGLRDDPISLQQAADLERVAHDTLPFEDSPAANMNQNPGGDGSRIQGHNRSAGTRLPAEDGSDSDSGQLSAERRRLSSLAIRRSVHSDIRRRAAACDTLRQTLGGGTQVLRSLLAFGAESTPQGISATPRTIQVQERAPGSTNGTTACNFSNTKSESAVPGELNTRALLILELPLCPQGHRPTLIAQINAQASPQFEQLGPYLFRIGCCKICRLQIPSLLDLSVDDVSGTCTDTILVVSPELSQAVTCSTTQAGKRPRSAMQGLCVPHGSEQFSVKQVHKNGPGKDQLQIIHTRLSYVAWISCWVPTEPALESPTRNDVQALARAYSTVPPPISEHAHGRAAARLGGTRATASPACRLCCNRMRLVVTLPCNGSVVCEAQRCSDILQTFKCHLHPQEMQCSWTSVAVESGRSSAEA